MRFRSVLRAAAIALTALFGVGLTAAHADSGSVSIRIFKAGFVIGGSAGSGVLHFHGHNYPLSVGGLSYGFTFGASETRFHGRVTNIRRPPARAHESRRRAVEGGQPAGDQPSG